MGYAITDGSVYLTQQMKLTKEVWVGWKKEEAAKSFMETWKKSKKRTCDADGFYVINVENTDVLGREVEEDLIFDDADFIDFEQNNENVECPENIYEDDCMKIFEIVDDGLKRIEKRAVYLAEKLAEVDKEISDIKHYIELAPNQNAINGYKLYKMLRERLVIRRYCKDELLLIGTFENFGTKGDFMDVLKKQDEGFDGRKYKPRSHGEVAKLFENI